jgi:uncharacterized RDD family membrane protein YckC
MKLIPKAVRDDLRKLIEQPGNHDEPIDTYVQVIAPEHIAFQHRVAGPFRRLFAVLLDGLIVVGTMFTVWYLTALVIAALSSISSLAGFGQLLEGLFNLVVAFLLTFSFIFYWFYGVILETWWNGQTFGKRALGLRVVSVEGQPINLREAAVRNFLRLLDFFPVVTVSSLLPLIVSGEDVEEELIQILSFVPLPTGLVGLVVTFLSPKFQRVGDYAAGTMVVKEDSRGIASLVKLEDERVSQLAGLIPNNFMISRKMAQALANYVDQRRYYHQSRRNEIARYVAIPLLDRFHLPGDTNYDLFMCALYYKAFHTEDTGGDDAGYLPNPAFARKTNLPPMNSPTANPPLVNSPPLIPEIVFVNPSAENRPTPQAPT